MIARALLAAIMAGLIAGLLMSVIQHNRVTPYIIAAETYEAGGSAAASGHEDGHSHDTASAKAHDHSGAWAPHDGLERTAFTVLANMLVGVAYALVLCAGVLLFNGAITPANGAIWGICGFLAFALAPAAGLPPELPGMPAADLLERQIWWWGTVVASAVGIGFLIYGSALWMKAAAVVVMALPHVIGAPHPESLTSVIPAGLANAYTANSLAVAAIFWVVLGYGLGVLFKRFNLTGEAA